MDAALLWYVSRATGVVTLVLFTATMVLGIVGPGRTSGGWLSRAGTLRLHRSISMTAIVFLAVHIVTAIVDGYVDLSFWDIVIPFGSGFDPLWIGLGAVAVDLMLAIAITSWFRNRLPLRLWRFVHLGAYLMWPVALLHGFGTSGGDGQDWWVLAVDAVCIASVLAALAWRLTGDHHPDTVLRRTAAEVHPRERIAS